MTTSYFQKFLGRVSYTIKNAKQLFPLIPENGILLFLRVLLSEALVRRRIYTAKVAGIELYFRSFSSDMQIINGLLRTELPDQYKEVDAFDGVIIDAGGNIGMAAIAFARKFPNRMILSLEPSSENFSLLENNTKTFNNIFTINCALGPEDTELELVNDSGNTAGFSLISEPAKTSPAEEREIVKVITIPTLMMLYNAEKIALLKLDIEGFELELLHDRPNWIKNVGLISIELHERYKPGATRAYINATEEGRTDLGCDGEMYFSVAS